MINWSEEKNETLRQGRGVTFEEVCVELDAGRLVALVPHPSRVNQQIYIVRLKGYCHAVPFVSDDAGGVFLKTIYPSREFQQKYGGES